MRRARFFGSLAVVAAAAFALAGCALLPAAVGLAAGSGSGAPQVGQCWNASYAHAGAWVNWKGSKAISCSSSHVLYTYEVGKISGISSKSWASPTDPDQPTDAIQTASENACQMSKLLPGLKWNQLIVQGFFFIPSEAQWAAGQRWVRCDVGLTRFDTDYAQQGLAKLPTKIQTLVASVTSDPKRYVLCVDTQVPAQAAGPLSVPSFDRVVDCTGDPQWELIGRGTMPLSAGSPFPTGSAAEQIASDICSKYASGANETWAGYLPTETSSGTVGTDRQVDCWVGKTSGSSSGGGGSTGGGGGIA